MAQLDPIYVNVDIQVWMYYSPCYISRNILFVSLIHTLFAQSREWQVYKRFSGLAKYP